MHSPAMLAGRWVHALSSSVLFWYTPFNGHAVDILICTGRALSNILVMPKHVGVFETLRQAKNDISWPNQYR